MPIDETNASPLPTGTSGTALVTGASHRVGRAIATELGRAGFGLVLTYRTRAEACAETARLAIEAARASGHTITARTEALDLGDVSAAEAFARRVAASDGRGARAIDLVVHNASEYVSAAFGAITRESIEAAQRVEVLSPLLMTQALRGSLAQSRLPGGGAVVFFSDTYALGRARAGFTPYMLAKSTVETLARQLAVEMAPSVRVHCIAPGVILWPEGFADAAKEAILARTPLARAGAAEDAARLVRFLALEAPFMTGETIRLDGGRALR
ncbi:MAG: SDR family oxidoreductase [bacterium]